MVSVMTDTLEQQEASTLVSDWGLDDWEGGFSQDTRVLTEGGFKEVFALAPGDRVLSLDPRRDAMSYRGIDEVAHYDYSGPVRVYRSRHLDLVVGAGHPMVARKIRGTGDRARVVPAATDAIGREELLEARSVIHDHRVPIKGLGWHRERTPWLVPAVKDFCPRAWVRPRQVATDAWLEMVATFLADGSLTNCYGDEKHLVTLRAHQDRAEEVTRIFAAMGFSPRVRRVSSGRHHFIVESEWLHHALSALTGRVPREVMSLDRASLQKFWAAYDACRTNGDPMAYKLHFHDQGLAEDMQEIVLKAHGRLHRISRHAGRGTWVLNFSWSQRSRWALYGQGEIQDYCGKLWGLRLEGSDTVLVERNGVIAWCGAGLAWAR